MTATDSDLSSGTFLMKQIGSRVTKLDSKDRSHFFPGIETIGVLSSL